MSEHSSEQHNSTTLLPEHRDQLRIGSGISDEVIEARGYYSIRSRKDNHHLEQAGFAVKQRRAPGLVLPMHTTDGQKGPHVFRSDHPRIVQGKTLKYEQPAGVGLRVDCPPLCQPNLADPSIALWITEGIKKGDSLASHGYTAIDLPGVWGFISKNPFGSPTVSVDLRVIGWEHRAVRIVFDSDVMTKQGVWHALLELTEVLERKGASVKHIYLPPGPGGEKVGVDDFLVAHADEGGANALDALVDAPPPKMQAERPAIEIVDALPPKLDRPLQVIDGHAYLYTPLVPLSVTEREILDPTTGRVLELDTPRVTVLPVPLVVRDDGLVYGFPGGPGFERLPFELDMRGEENVEPRMWWAPSGVRTFLSGQRPDSSSIAERLVQAFDAFIDFTGSLAEQIVLARVMACVALATWLLDQLDTAPYVHAVGEFEAGKTRLVEVLVALSFLGQLSLKSTTFAVLRDVAHFGGALGIDEAEAAREADEDPNKRSLILSGYRRSDTTIAHKIPSPNGIGWVVVRTRTFSPRFFASISSPDATQASRSLIVPMVRSNDASRTTSAVANDDDWPFARRQLTSDLWAWALVHLPLVRSAWDRAPEAIVGLRGRELEVWRPALCAARLLEDDGVPDMLAAIEQVIAAYREEKDELADDLDANRLIVMAIAQQLFDLHKPRTDTSDTRDACDTPTEGLGNCTITMRLTARDLAHRIERLRKEEFGMDAAVGGVTEDQVGRRLQKPLRVGVRKRTGNERFREVQAKTLERLFITHGVDYPHGPPKQDPDPEPEGARSDSRNRNFGHPPTPSVSSDTSVISVTPSSSPDDTSDTRDSSDTRKATPPESTVTRHTSRTPPEAYPTPAYERVVDAEGLARVADIVLGADWLAIDTETTGLNPLQSRLRLVQLACAAGVYVIDCNTVPKAALRALVERLFTAPSEPRLTFHNAVFDIRFLQCSLGLGADLVPRRARLFDTLIAARILDSRGKTEREEAGKAPPMKFGLRDVFARRFDLELSKGEQKAGWDRLSLRNAKWDYAAKDAAATLELAVRLAEELRDEGLEDVMAFEMQAFEAVLWMTNNGAPVDIERWLEAVPDVEVVLAELNAEAGTDPTESKLWNTPERILELLADRGLRLPDTKKATLQAHLDKDPLLPLLVVYRRGAKDNSTYGRRMLEGWLSPEGRLHPSWQTLGTETGRMACRSVPFHGIPRDAPGQEGYRSAIRAPQGKAIVKADYDQLQVRITAALANDAAMLTVYQHRDGDVHLQTTASVLGIPVSEVSKDQRQTGKGVTFGLLFGQNAEGLQAYLKDKYKLEYPRSKVGEMRQVFFNRWPGLRRRMEHPDNSGRSPRTIYDPGGSGRRRLEVTSPQEKLNTPVQMVEATGFKRAMIRLYAERAAVPSARLIAAIHDELVLEVDVAEAEAAAVWLKRVMEEEMQAVLPQVDVRADPQVGQDWAGSAVVPGP